MTNPAIFPERILPHFLDARPKLPCPDAWLMRLTLGDDPGLYPRTTLQIVVLLLSSKTRFSGSDDFVAMDLRDRAILNGMRWGHNQQPMVHLYK
jgi:hypothetical protein